MIAVQTFEVPESAEVEEMTDYPAIRLLVDRARLADPHFRLTAENAGPIRELCAALEGLPLSIELAIPLLSASQRLPEESIYCPCTIWSWSPDLLSTMAIILNKESIITDPYPQVPRDIRLGPMLSALYISILEKSRSLAVLIFLISAF